MTVRYVTTEQQCDITFDNCGDRFTHKKINNEQ